MRAGSPGKSSGWMEGDPPWREHSEEKRERERSPNKSCKKCGTAAGARRRRAGNYVVRARGQREIPDSV